MNTKTAPPRKTVKKKLPPASEAEVLEWLKANDLWLYCKKKSKSEARMAFQEQTQKGVSAKQFRKHCDNQCEWFGCTRRFPVRKNNSLTARQWERLKRIVSELLPDLQGVSLDWAVEIVRSEMSCSKAVLLGLPARLHVWAK